MEPALTQVYDKLKDRMSQADFLARLEKERAAFDGLLDDEALALLILDEEGRNDGAVVTLAEARGRAEATVRAEVVALEGVRTFRRGEREGRVGNALIRDATGEARLVLWDRDVEKLEDGMLYPGARVTVVNARVKDDPRYGLELHGAPWTALEVEGALDPAKRKLLMDTADERAAQGRRDVEGTLLARSTTRAMPSEDGVRFECDVDLDTPEGRARVVLTGELVRLAQRLDVGARVRLTHVEARVRGAATEWHAGPATRMEGAA